MSTPLSDKARGKRRAADDVASGSASSDSAAADPVRTLVVRFSEGEPDLRLAVHTSTTVRDIKTQIRDAREALHARRLRLIHAGRLLAPDLCIHEWLETLAARQAPANAGAERGPDEEAAAWVHCAVGQPLEEGEDEDVGAPAPQMRPLRGFDRLAAAGFSEEDIEGMRSHFHSRQRSYALSGALDLDSADEHAHVLEDQWIEALNPGTTGGVPGGDSGDERGARTSPLVLGLLTGFFFPILPLFFFKDALPPFAWAYGAHVERQPTVVFSRQMQMGIIVGLGANVVFALWRYLIAVDDQHL